MINPIAYLKRQLDYYKAHQAELVERYEGKVLVIHDEKVVQAFDDRTAAYQFGKRNFEPGSFFLIKCTPGNEEYTATYTSRYVPPREAYA